MHQKIAAIRRLLRLSQEQAASLCKFSLRTYQRIESGGCSLRVGHLENLAAGFQCTIEDILFFDPEMDIFPQGNKSVPILLREYVQLQKEVALLRYQIKLLTNAGGAAA